MQTSPAQYSPRSNTLTIAQLIFSSLSILGSIAGVGLCLTGGLALLLGEKSDGTSATSLLSLAWVSGLITALVLPSFLFSLQRLRGINPTLPRINGFRLSTILIPIWPLVLVLGNWASKPGALTPLILPPLQILAVALPLWWLIEFARRRIPNGSLQRGWGIINFSLLITTPLAIVVELIVFLLLVLLFLLWMMSRPDLLSEIELLAQNILNSGSDLDSTLSLLTPYLQKPVVILSILALLSGIIPLLEELLKPLAIWFLAPRRPTPSEGFTAGILCGGSFALLESLLSLAEPVEQGWAVVAVGRAGTGLLHITTAALTGYAMARAWQKRAYLQLGLTYLFSSALHGLWNGLSILYGMNAIFNGSTANSPGILARITNIAPAALMILAFFLLALLWGVNRHLQQSSLPPGPAILDTPQSY